MHDAQRGHRPSDPEQVVRDIAFGRAVELVAGVPCTDLGQKRTCVCGHHRKTREEKGTALGN
jgi:hypothetical protein